MISSINVKWTEDEDGIDEQTGKAVPTDCEPCCDGYSISPSDRFHSVEFSIEGINLLYQSRIWMSTTASMFALVKENSIILKRLHVGEVLDMKFYTMDTLCPTRNFETKIEYITKDENGRFKGNFLVGLAILRKKDPPVQMARFA